MGIRVVILAAGLTPAWQQVLSFRRFVPGEVNRAQTADWCASGKVLNVGCALHQLGAESKTLCTAGGPAGQQMRADFDRLGVPIRWINSSVPTRVCTTILDETSGQTTELVENSSEIPPQELTAFYDAYVEEAQQATLVVLTGSLPENTTVTFFRSLLEKTTAKSVLDIRGPELEQALTCRPFLVKPNREELARTVGRLLDDDEDLVNAMAMIRQRGAEWVVVSNGPAPLLALGPEALVRIQIPQVAVKNPIGCGDCLAAGIAAAVDRGFSMRDALEIGVRAAAENATELLPARRLSRLT
jgi:1-phosphofructokinase family hexose kinase